jgi:hypothetical protein
LADVLMVLPVVTGKAEEWRRFAQQLQGSRQVEFTDALRDLGMESLSVWLANTQVGHIAVALFTSTRDPVDMQDMLTTSQQPFDVWFKERVRVLHGVDLSSMIGGLAAEHILDWTSDA